ncbi:hypothetical protein [Paenibacillus sp. URB8-2]|uniref:hypothetical protein n=1 Tax=Paenibacillus sp. URB8-2 TaxID=2741301 RepID=UPI0015B97628|nr:hypothetical protein [Paenibacillus sp. URB8-2]BCG60929.1 hypothetical protein PUR_43540 [Paenibacillus sp. URB8-2]
MNVLGAFGNLYMASLLILLVVGLLFAIYYLLKKTYGYISGVSEQRGSKTTGTIGGILIMKTNGWLKLAVFSFVGLIISVVLLNVTNPANSGTVTSTNSQHNSHVNGTAGFGATMQGTMSGTVPMDQMNQMMQRMNQLQQDMMQMQQQYMGGMQPNMNMGNSGSMGTSGSSGGMMDDMDMMNMGSGSNMNNGGNMNNSGSMNNGGNMNNGSNMGMM